jgi:hypothetical protein
VCTRPHRRIYALFLPVLINSSIFGGILFGHHCSYIRAFQLLSLTIWFYTFTPFLYYCFRTRSFSSFSCSSSVPRRLLPSPPPLYSGFLLLSVLSISYSGIYPCNTLLVFFLPLRSSPVSSLYRLILLLDNHLGIIADFSFISCLKRDSAYYIHSREF